MTLRLATWNCRQGIDRKRRAIEALRADVIVIPECASTPAIAREIGVSFLWRGDNPRKGLGIVALNGWTIEPIEESQPLPWVLPVRVIDPDGAHALDLLGVWTVARKDGRPGYSGQIAEMLTVWSEALAEGHVAVAGDFNCSLQGPAKVAHRSNIAALGKLGLQLSYHTATALDHGAETTMTLSWVGPGRVPLGYHCDFVFLPGPLLSRMVCTTIGWEAEESMALSDHLPVVVEFE